MVLKVARCGHFGTIAIIVTEFHILRRLQHLDIITRRVVLA